MIKIQVNLEEFMNLAKAIGEKRDVEFASKNGEEEMVVSIKYGDIRVYVKNEVKIVLYCNKNKYRFRLPRPEE